jgi:hypothetical protein
VLISVPDLRESSGTLTCLPARRRRLADSRATRGDHQHCQRDLPEGVKDLLPEWVKDQLPDAERGEGLVS